MIALPSRSTCTSRNVYTSIFDTPVGKKGRMRKRVSPYASAHIVPVSTIPCKTSVNLKLYNTVR